MRRFNGLFVFQLIWHLAGVALVLVSIAHAFIRNQPVEEHVWLFVLAGMGIQTSARAPHTPLIQKNG